VNALLLQSERTLAPEDGMPRRPWYRHVLAAPGWYTGYSPKTLPGIREAIEAKGWAESEEQAAKLGRVLEAEAAVLDQAAEILERIAPR
jgi:N-acetylated-alpha-linked acidic dipeptidase